MKLAAIFLLALICQLALFFYALVNGNWVMVVIALIGFLSIVYVSDNTTPENNTDE